MTDAQRLHQEACDLLTEVLRNASKITSVPREDREALYTAIPEIRRGQYAGALSAIAKFRGNAAGRLMPGRLRDAEKILRRLK
ncbi:MAG TPA: hypothetical protein VFC31_14085 [Candidatus Limnocylindria bacterium]|nr:hypothetical protein [Candidatus Limnocylindria bacterium]